MSGINVLNRLVILFGSETGNAEEVSYFLNDELCKLGYNCQVFSLDVYNVLDLPEENYVIFITSTTGDGDLPGSMKKFWSLLMRKSLSQNCLTNVNYSVFGLGDSSYDKFNFVARKLQARLKQLGAVEFLPLGLGDDQAKYSYFTAYNNWYKDLQAYLTTKPQLINAYSTDVARNTAPLSSAPDVYAIASFDNDNQNEVSMTVAITDTSKIHRMTVIENKRMTTASWSQDVRHIRLGLSQSSEEEVSSSLNYLPGDIAEVFYCNPPELVQKAMQLLIVNNPHNAHHTADTLLRIQRNKVVYETRHSRVNEINCTIHDLFSKILDIGAIPKRSFFSTMAQYAADVVEKDKLNELSSAMGTDLYFDYCIKEKRNYIDVLQEFRSVQPTLSALLSCIPLVQPRQYSIASSSLVNPLQVELCVAIVKYQTPYRRHKSGLCSGYLSTLTVGDPLSIRIKRGSVQDTVIGKMIASTVSAVGSVDTNSTTTSVVPLSMILIGPGTGIAPMRAIVQQHLHHQHSLLNHNHSVNDSNSGALSDVSNSNSSSSTALPRVLVLFGCRKRSQDYLYGAEWDAINDHWNNRRNSDNNTEEVIVNDVAVDIPGNSIDSPISTDNIDIRLQSDDNSIAVTSTTTKQSVLHHHYGAIRAETAFSQDQESKDYVTHSIQRNGAVIWDMIQQGCCIFVSGSANRMPADVKKAIVTAISVHSGNDTAWAEGVVGQLIRSKRYVVEAWN